MPTTIIFTVIVIVNSFLVNVPTVVYEHPMSDKIEYYDESYGIPEYIDNTDQKDIYEYCATAIHSNYEEFHNKFIEVWCDFETTNQYILDVKNWKY